MEACWNFGVATAPGLYDDDGDDDGDDGDDDGDDGDDDYNQSDKPDSRGMSRMRAP
ncbi:hypothetical protein MY10362_007946, partial [Beauveria mimosiformis]